MEKENLIISEISDEKYTITKNNVTYNLQINIRTDHIEIKSKRELSYIFYEGIFSLEDFPKFHRLFLMFDSLNEIYEFIISKIKSKFIDFKIHDDYFSLFLNIKLDELTQKIEIKIPKNPEKRDPNSILDDLTNHILDLTNEIKNLKEENNLLKEHINYVSIDDVTSSRIANDNQLSMIKSWISQNNQIELNLIYRAGLDGDQSANFHSKCDNKGPTLTIVETLSGRKFGGFTNMNWDSSGSYKTNDNEAFVFSLDFKKKYKCTNQSYVIYGNGSYGPTFGGGHDFYICDKSFSAASSYSNFTHSYGNGENYQYNKYCYLSGSYNFLVKEIEVYTVKKI